MSHLPLAIELYREFLDEVVNAYVFEDVVGSLSEKQRAKVVEKKTHIDARLIRLMTISGKGGWNSDPKLRKDYSGFRNVTLLDHLLSVVRGTLLLRIADCDLDIDKNVLRNQLIVGMVVAFMHDLDKDLRLPRNSRLTVEMVQERLQRYGIDSFLDKRGIHIESAQLLSLIELAEDSQARNTFPAAPTPRSFERVTRYVKLADKLDGAWLSEGLSGVQARLEKDRTMEFYPWRKITIHDPHHPFILDALQRHLSRACSRITHTPPLIEVHLDGTLCMMVPEEQHEAVVEHGLNELLAKSLPFSLELTISNRGVPALQNERVGYSKLQDFMHQTVDERNLSRLFLIKSHLLDLVTSPLDEILNQYGLAPRWPKKVSGATVTPYSLLTDVQPFALKRIRKAGLLALLLNLKLAGDKKNNYPAYEEREKKLLVMCDLSMPEWLSGISDGQSRRALTALVVMSLAEEDATVDRAVWQQNGLLERWWEGTENSTPFKQSISSEAESINSAVIRRFRQILSGQLVTGSNISARQKTGHCLFTDEPVEPGKTIRQADNLYGVKISAFSGRDNRPENLAGAAKGITHVSPVSIAEHRLRQKAHALAGGKPSGVPSLLSSPTTSSLFGGMALTDDKATATLSVYDITRLEKKKGKVLNPSLLFTGRQRIARFERWPERVKDQLDMLDLLLRSCLRTGRPIHLFRGLPTEQKAFFHCDALPMILIHLLGGTELRLEQFDSALTRLEMAKAMLNDNSLGYQVLQMYANPGTRFGAICRSWCRFRESAKEKKNKFIAVFIRRLEHQFINMYEKRVEDTSMQSQDAPFVTLGELAATIQKTPPRTSSANEEMLLLNLTMKTLRTLIVTPQTADNRSLINGIAGELDTKLNKGKSFLTYSVTRQERCLEFAEFFVKNIWEKVLQRRLPSQRQMRSLGSIYRMSFILAARKKHEDS